MQTLTTNINLGWSVFGTLQAGVSYTSAPLSYQLKVQSYSPTWAQNGTNVLPRTLSWSYWWQKRCNSASGSGNPSSTSTQSSGAPNNTYINIIYGSGNALKHYGLSATITSPSSQIIGDSKSTSITD